MTTEQGRGEVEFCPDSALGYERNRTRFVPDTGLLLDEQYRLAHLPLIAPDHPGVIPAQAGSHYRHGRHPRVYSLVMPVPWRELCYAPAFVELENELRASACAPKIAWELMGQRRERLHATLCGSLAIEPERPPALTEEQRRALEAIGPIRVELRGLFSGNVNVGRLYLRVYPECRDGENLFRTIQRIVGSRVTGLYLVGLYNLVDDLSADETEALAALIDRWWNRPILQLEISNLWILWARDDLVLEAGVDQLVPLTRQSVARGGDQ